MPEVMSIEVDEEFDPRPPSSPFGLRDPEGNWNYGMIGGIAIAIVLVLLLIFVVVKPFSSEKAAEVSNWKPNDPTQDLNYLETYPSTSQMHASMQKSLEDWALYYTTGKLTDLESSFDLAGPHYAQLVAGQPTIAKSPEEGDPAIIQLGPIGKVSRKDDIYTTRVVVTWTKPGSPDPKKYMWDIDMKSFEAGYVLHSVEETDSKAKQPINFCGAVDVIAELDDDKKVAKETSAMPPERALERTLDMLAIRLKSWELLETAVAGTDSEADVAPIAKDYRNLVQIGKKAKNVSDLSDNEPPADMPLFRESIEDRASQECKGANIKDR